LTSKGTDVGLLKAIYLLMNASTLAEDWVDKPLELLDKIMTGIRAMLSKTLVEITSIAVEAARLSYVAMAIIGLLLWASGFSPYTGRRLMIGAVILAMVTELLM